MVRALYDSVDTLIAPEILHHLTDIPVTSVRRLPMEGDFSGSRLEAVETKGDQAQQFVLKHMTKKTDWLMQATGDDHCRSVALWRYGLLK